MQYFAPLILQQKAESYEVPKGDTDTYAVPDETVRYYLFK